MTNVSRTKSNNSMKPKAPPKLKPHGETDGCKRTPVNLGDAYQGRAKYGVEAVLSEHLRQGVSFLHVKWEGIPEDGNTWEPVKHLVGDAAEAALAAFREKQARDIAAVRCPYWLAILLRSCPRPLRFLFAPILRAFRRPLNHFHSFLYFIFGFGFDCDLAFPINIYCSWHLRPHLRISGFLLSHNPATSTDEGSIP